MKILLIRPPSDTHLLSPPLGILYLAAALRGENDVRVIDCILEGNNFEKFKKVLLEEKFDILGISAFSFQLRAAYKAAEISKKINPKCKVVMGGIHASTCPKEVINNKHIDFVFVGEGERSFPEFISKLEKKKSFEKVNGICYVKNKKIKINPKDIINDLDSLPMPAWDLLPPNRYPEFGGQLKYPVAPVLTSRGCPFQCTFCSSHIISGRKWRPRSPEKVVKEVIYLKNNFGIREINFMDDNFTFDRERTRKICGLLIKDKANLVWECPNGVRADRVDKELLKLMKKAGCYSLNFGIESGSKRIHKLMKKGLNFKKLKKTIDSSRRLGILTTGTFILGYPTETKEDIEKTIKIAKSLNLDRASFFTFQPLPGSEIFNWMMKNKKINKDKIKWDNYSYSQVSWSPESLSKKELKNLQRKAILSFYLRPAIFIRYMQGLMSWTKFKFFLKLTKSYILGSKEH